MNLKVILPLVIVVAAASVGGFLLYQKSSQTATILANAVPEIPTSGIQNPELLKRIQSATRESREGTESLANLAELSRLYHANGFTNEAWECYAVLVVVEPDEPRWPYRFARILAGYGQLEEATPLFQRAAQIDPNYPPTFIRLGDTLFKQNLFAEAASSYRDALAIDSQNPYALVGLARVAIAAEDWTEARTQLEKAVEFSNYRIGADLLGDVYEKLGMKAKESDVLQNSSWGSYADIPDPWSLTLVDDCYDAYQVSIAGGWVAHQGDTRLGLRFIKRAIELEPSSPLYHYQIAGLYQRLNDDTNAEIHFKKTVELQPDFSDAWLALVEIAKRRQSPTLVRRTLDAGLEAAPDSPSLNIERGKEILAQGRLEQALPYFQKAIDVRPYEAIGYIELSKAYLTFDRVDEGVAQMKLALEQEPANPIALSAMAFDAIKRRDKEAADKWLGIISKQGRMGQNELGKLVQLYKSQFGQ